MNNIADNPMVIVWVVMGMTAVIFWRLFRRESQRLKMKDRFEKSQCVSCGYDLRASEDRCPECGFPIQPPELPLTMPLNSSALKNDWPPAPQETRRPDPAEFRVDVFASAQMSVEALAEQLEFRGISTSVSTRHTNVLDPISLMKIEHWDTKLAVWSGDVDRATEIIQNFSEIFVGRRSQPSGKPTRGQKHQSAT